MIKKTIYCDVLGMFIEGLTFIPYTFRYAQVIADADQSMLDDNEGELSTSVLKLQSPLKGARSRSASPSQRKSASPVRPPGFADSTFSAVQAALSKRQIQVILLLFSNTLLLFSDFYALAVLKY